MTLFAKVFFSGRSQAVRLPKEVRFKSDVVTVSRRGNALLLAPVGKRAWPKGYFAKLGRLSKDLVRPKDRTPRPLGFDLDQP